MGVKDYFDIISNPMDLSTVTTTLKNGGYADHDAFAKDVRLIFQNAVTYNSKFDNPCHIAALELLEWFDERFRPIARNFKASESRSKKLARHASDNDVDGPRHNALEMRLENLCMMRRVLADMASELKSCKK